MSKKSGPQLPSAHTQKEGGTPINALKLSTPFEPGDAHDFDDDLQLMARVASGERSAQCALAARLSGRVRRLSRSLLRDLADADDTAQTALLEILRSAGQYRGLGPLERWGDRIVVRAAAALLRKRYLSLHRFDFDAELDDIVDPPAEHSTTDDVAKPMTEYLERLPEPIKMALLLRHALGYSLEEIGELLAITPNAAKKRVSRGHQAVRRMIRKDRVVGLRLGGNP